jgi:hypothetical protein
MDFIIVQYSGRDCNVLPYSDDYEAVTGVTAWTDQETGGKTWIILIHHDEEASIWMADTTTMLPPHSLINLNQLQAYNIDVEDNPSRRRRPLLIADSDTSKSILWRILFRRWSTQVSFSIVAPT